MDTVEDLIAKILIQRKDLTHERIQELVEEKKRETHDLLSEEGAARLVAEELLVEAGRTEAVPSIAIGKLVSGLNDVTLTARVETVEPMKSFVRQDGSTGKFARIILAHESNKIGLTVWDTKAEELVKLSDLIGRSLNIKHGYTRARSSGEVELNAGDRCEITVLPDRDTSLSRSFTPIGEIEEPAIDLTLRGIIISVPRVYEFSRNGQIGTVLRTVVADKTGSIPLVAWNEKAEDLRTLKRNQILEIQNGRLRRGRSGRTEVHIDFGTKVKIAVETPEGFEIPEFKFYSIKELTPDLPNVNLMGRVVGTSDPQEVEKTSGKKVKLSRILVGDETGIVSISLWDDKAELASLLKVGEVLKIEDAMPNVRFGQLSINAGKAASIQQVEHAEREIQVEISKIGQVKPSSRIVAIEAEVIGIPERREVTTAKGERIRVTSIRARDETGEARVSFWRSHAAGAEKLEQGDKIRLYGILPKQGLSEVEFNTIQASRLELITPIRTKIPSPDAVRQFIDLKDGEEAWIRALILDPGDNATLSSICTRCEKPTAPSKDRFLCQNHGPQDEVDWLMTMSMRLDDGTDTIVMKVRTKNPKDLIGKSFASAQKELLAKGMATIALPIDATGKLAGMRIDAFGVMRHDPQTARRVFHTEKLLLSE